MAKQLFLGIATVFFGALFFIIIRDALFTFDFRRIVYWMRIIISFGVFGGFTVLSALLFRKRVFLIEMIILIGIYWVIFGINGVYLVAGGIFILLNFVYSVIVARERNDRVKIVPLRIMPRGLYLFVISLITLISAGYYFLPTIQMKAEEFEIPEHIEKSAETISLKFLARSVPEDVRNQLKENEELQSSFNQQVEGAVSEVLGIAESLARPYLIYIPALFTVGFFLGISAFIWLWKLIIILFGSLLYILFKATGFIKITLVDKQVEEVQL